MSDFEIGPLFIALAASTLGSTLLVWHRRGGARWMFALGGFFFILSRFMVAAICVFILVGMIEALRAVTKPSR